MQAAGRQGESWSAGTGQAGSNLGLQVGRQAQPVVDTPGVQWDWDNGGYRDRKTLGDKPGEQGAGAEDTGWPYCGGPGNVSTALEVSKGLHILGGWLGTAPLGGPTPMPLIHWVPLPGQHRRASPPLVSPQCPLLRKRSSVLAVEESKKELSP